MQLSNQTAIALLVVIELSVEFIADTVEQLLGQLPWITWWSTAQSYHIPDIVICLTMMGIIIAAIALIDPKPIDDFVKTIWQKIQHYRAVRKSKRFKQNNGN